MSATDQRITRDQIEAKFRELTGEVTTDVETARPQILTIALAVGVVVLAAAYLFGRRAGKSRSTMIEVRRL
ncbi:MAG: hypothetical protein JO368_07475 [Acidimicrobiales bacterium]|nr:hypothetical protein [Acidimicrobiales bacterium]